MPFCCNSPPVFVEWSPVGCTDALKRQKFGNVESAVRRYVALRSSGYLAVALYILVSECRVDLLIYEPR